MRTALDRAPEASHDFAGLELSNRKTVIVAVSGGSDSMALLDLANRTFGQGSTGLLAVTVDHGLRPEAAGEARRVAEHCAGRGIHHLTLRWSAEGTRAGGLIARAREARYRLLAEAAGRAGTDLVLLGHTADDQAETVAMRGQRRVGAEGWDRGGAGMARATLFEGKVWFARPLLGMSRQALRAHLGAQGIGWVDDPTNEDFRYERARIRAALAREAGEGRVAGLLRAASEAASLRVEIDRAAARLIAEHASMPSPGLFQLDTAFHSTGDGEAALHAFRGLLATAGGREQLPDHGRARRLLAELSMPGLCATLSRTRVEVHRMGIFLARENRGLPSLPVIDGLVWDGRHRVSGFSGDEDWSVVPMGAVRARERAGDFSGPPPRLVRAGFLAEPVLERAHGAPAGADAAPGVRFERLVSPFARFLGEHDLALASALARLIGAAPPPPSPFARHIGG